MNLSMQCMRVRPNGAGLFWGRSAAPAVFIQHMSQQEVAEIPKKIIQVEEIPEIHQEIFEREIEQERGGKKNRAQEGKAKVQETGRAVLRSLIEKRNEEEKHAEHRKIPEMVFSGEPEEGENEAVLDALALQNLRVQQTVLQKVENLPEEIQKQKVQGTTAHPADGAAFFLMRRRKKKRAAQHDEQ